MADEYTIKMAKTLIQYSLEVKKGEWVVISADPVCMELVRECYREILHAGANPSVLFHPSGFTEILYKEGNDEQLSFISDFQLDRVKKADCILNILGSENICELSNIDSKKIALRAKSNAQISEIMHKRSDNGSLRWTLCQYPTNADAQQANMSLSDYKDFIYRACMLYENDPALSWKKIHDEQEQIVQRLNGTQKLHIVSKDTDITMSVKDRVWINSDGHHNFPSGEVFSAPVEDSVNGKICFSFPGIYMSKEIENISLEFKDGRVTKYSAEKGSDLLAEILQIDEGSSRLGEVAVGTNYGITKFTKNMLFDEKIGGTVHLALGNSYGECGGKNRSAIHWDMLCDMKQEGKIYADNKLVYENGKFLF